MSRKKSTGTSSAGNGAYFSTGTASASVAEEQPLTQATPSSAAMAHIDPIRPDARTIRLFEIYSSETSHATTSGQQSTRYSQATLKPAPEPT